MSVISDIANELHKIKTSITTALANKGVTSSGQWENFKSEIEAIVPTFDTGTVIGMRYMFSGCSSLTSVDMYGMKVAFDLKSCIKLSTEEINKIFNNCGQAVSGATITLPNTDDAKSADNSIATAKGWTIVYA